MHYWFLIKTIIITIIIKCDQVQFRVNFQDLLLHKYFEIWCRGSVKTTLKRDYIHCINV